MNKLTITITITDPVVLEAWDHATEEFIENDFIGCPEYWLDGADIEVEKEG